MICDETSSLGGHDVDDPAIATSPELDVAGVKANRVSSLPRPTLTPGWK